MKLSKTKGSVVAAMLIAGAIFALPCQTKANNSFDYDLFAKLYGNDWNSVTSSDKLGISTDYGDNCRVTVPSTRAAVPRLRGSAGTTP